MTGSSWWYGFVLRLFPTDFRDRFADEIREVIETQRETRAGAGPLPLVAFHVATTVDLFGALASQYLRGARRLAGIMLVVSAVGHVLYDVADPAAAMGAPAWAVTVIAVILGIRSQAEAAPYGRAG